MTKKTIFILLLFCVTGLVILYYAPGGDRISHGNIMEPDEIGPEVSIDCMYTMEEALQGQEIPDDIQNSISLVNLKYCGFDSALHIGQLLIASELKSEVLEIFDSLLHMNFPIEKVIPVVRYDWSDSLSMADNNTSGFNYRTIRNSGHLSDHAFGRAIDINPRLNPYIHFNSKKMEPVNAVYDKHIPGTITASSPIVRIFKLYGWKWGGDWKYSKDYQHFYKD